MLDAASLADLVASPSPPLRTFRSIIQRTLTSLQLADLAAESAALTRQHFGRTIRLFAPLYISNTCLNSCVYCGFSRKNNISRRVLSLQEVLSEADILLKFGFRNLLLVAGEHPSCASNDFLVKIISALRPTFPALSLEVAPATEENYSWLVAGGAEGLTIFQETYLPTVYAAAHPAGPKKDYNWRLQAPERAYRGGFRRIGVGSLLGLTPWREEAMHLATHIEYLQRECWQAHINVSFPRLCPTAGGYNPPHPVSNQDFLHLICALRIAFPRVGFVLSTRESPALRDILARLGITTMSAGARTDPGGYAISQAACTLGSDKNDTADPQFQVSDSRTAAAVAASLRALGLDPVWKDWDSSILPLPPVE